MEAAPENLMSSAVREESGPTEEMSLRWMREPVTTTASTWSSTGAGVWAAATPGAASATPIRAARATPAVRARTRP